MSDVRLELERQVLALALVSEAAARRVVVRCEDDWLRYPQHRALMGAVRGLVADGVVPDTLAVAQRLGSEGLPKVGGQVGLVELVEEAPPASMLSRRLDELEAHVRADRVRSACEESLGSLTPETAAKAAAQLATAMRDIGGTGSDSGSDVVGDNLGLGVFDWLADDSAEVIWPTPWRGVNRMIGGLRAGRLHIVAGYSKHGKSVAMLQMFDAAVAGGARGWYCSLEMPVAEVEGRWAAVRGFVDYPALMRRDKTQLQGLAAFKDSLEGVDAETRVTGAVVSPDAVYAQAASGEYDVIVYDHLHRFSSDRETLEQAVRVLKNAALDFGVAVVAGAQLVKGAADGSRPEPTVQMLRGTAVLEQEADLAMSVWREPGLGQGLGSKANLRVLACRFAAGEDFATVEWDPCRLSFVDPGGVR